MRKDIIAHIHATSVYDIMICTQLVNTVADRLKDDGWLLHHTCNRIIEVAQSQNIELFKAKEEVLKCI